MQTRVSTTLKYSIVVSHNSKRRLTRAFIHGLKAHEALDIVEDIRLNMETIVLPTLLPTLLIARRLCSAIDSNGDSNTSIVRMEHQTGVKTKWHPSKPCCGTHDTSQTLGAVQPDNVDFDPVYKELTSVLAKTAYSEFVCSVHLPTLDDLDDINQMLVAATDTDVTRMKLAAEKLRERNEYIRATLKGTLLRAQYLSKRAQALLQTVRPCIVCK